MCPLLFKLAVVFIAWGTFFSFAQLTQGLNHMTRMATDYKNYFPGKRKVQRQQSFLFVLCMFLLASALIKQEKKFPSLKKQRGDVVRTPRELPSPPPICLHTVFYLNPVHFLTLFCLSMGGVLLVGLSLME